MARKKGLNEVTAGEIDVGVGEAPGAAAKKPRVRKPDPEVDDGDAGDEDFLAGTARKDREATKAQHVDDGLAAVAKMVDRMKKGIAYANGLADFGVKLTVLTEVADTAAAVAADARRAVRNAQAENRNLQPS